MSESAILAFASDELGLVLTDAQAEMVSTFTDGPFHEAVWQCGRRGGKSLLADVLALYDVAVRGHLQAKVRRGEPRVSAIIAPRLDQAESHIRSCADLIQNSRPLRRMVTDERSDELVFSNGARIRAYPCSARSIRGAAWSSCVLDEAAHFVLIDSSNAADARIYEAALPSLAQFGDEGWLISISTPLWRSGEFWRRVERAQTGRFPYLHHRHYSTADMNPRIPAAWLEERRREDPELFSREFEARFLDGAASYLSAVDVSQAVRSGIGRLPAVSGVQYRAAIDPAFNMDRFALVVAHKSGERAVVDGVWAWHRMGYEAVLDEVRDVAAQYGVRTLLTDQAAAEPIRAGLVRRGLAADYRPWSNESKRDAMASVKVALNTGALELPDDPALVEELLGLEARPTPSGMTRIAAAGSGHDDRATALAAVVNQLIGRHRSSPAELASLLELNTGLAFTASRSLGALGVADLGGSGRFPR